MLAIASARDKDLFVSLCISLQGCRLSVTISTLQFSQMDERKVTAFCFPLIVFHWPCCVCVEFVRPHLKTLLSAAHVLSVYPTGLSCIGDCKICRYNTLLHIEEKNLRPHRFSIGPTYLSQAQVYRAQNGKFSLPQVCREHPCNTFDRFGWTEKSMPEDWLGPLGGLHLFAWNH